MNKMPEVAKLLGVEMGEWFRVYGNDYCLTSNGIINAYKVRSPVTLNSLLSGTNEVEKLPFRPKRGERYYFVCENGTVDWTGGGFTTFDLTCIAFGNCFRSEAEAEANRDRILAKFEEIKKEMEG